MKTLTAIGICILHIIVYGLIIRFAEPGMWQRLCCFWWGAIMWVIISAWIKWKPNRISLP